MSCESGHDSANFIAGMLNDVCFGNAEREPLEATIDRYFSSDYRQCTDGHMANRDEFVEHIRALRTKVAGGRIDVLEALRQGRRIADRHLVTVTKRDGSQSRVEVYLFGEFADDGRLCRVDEVSRVVSGATEDAALARTR